MFRGLPFPKIRAVTYSSCRQEMKGRTKKGSSWQICESLRSSPSSVCEHLREYITSKDMMLLIRKLPHIESFPREPFRFAELLLAYKWTECEIKTGALWESPEEEQTSRVPPSLFIWDWSNKSAIKGESEKTEPLRQLYANKNCCIKLPYTALVLSVLLGNSNMNASVWAS